MTEITISAERLRRINAGEKLLDVYPKCRDKPKMYAGTWRDVDAMGSASAWLRCDLENVADAYLALGIELKED